MNTVIWESCHHDLSCYLIMTQYNHYGKIVREVLFFFVLYVLAMTRYDGHWGNIGSIIHYCWLAHLSFLLIWRQNRGSQLGKKHSTILIFARRYDVLSLIFLFNITSLTVCLWIDFKKEEIFIFDLHMSRK